MKVRKIMCCTLAAAMVMTNSALPCNVSVETIAAEAGDTFTYEDFECTYLEDGTVEISDYNGEDTEVVVPEEINGYKVTSIGGEAFAGCSNLTSIELPESVTSMYAYAFSGCSSLMSIDLPDQITTIDGCTFEGCSSLESIKIPDGVVDILGNAFYGCTSLKKIELPDSLQRIYMYAFYNCKSLEEIVFPDGLTYIDTEAFHGCESLVSVYLPENVKVNAPDDQYYGGPFLNCSNLEEILVDDNNPYIGSVDGILYSKETMSIIECPSAKTGEISIPDGIVRICSHAFYNCSSITGIVLPDSVTTIRYFAFSNCTNLCNILLSNNLERIDWFAFRNCVSLTSVRLPENLEHISEYVFYECKNLTSIFIPASIYIYPDLGVFDGCENLTIYALKGSAAEALAEELDIPFIAVGDTDENGSIDYFDAIAALQYDAELLELTEGQLFAGDVNGDGNVDSFDAIKILQYDAELIESFE